MSEPESLPRIIIDADACPVKDEIYRVAARHKLHVLVVANSYMMVPKDPMIERIVVPSGLDAADNWIAEHATARDVVVTADVPLAARCVKVGAAVLAPTGREFTPSSIGMALATRNLMQDMRDAGAVTRGPKPYSPRDRSTFLSTLDTILVRLKKHAVSRT
ncbi:YaiI/YqxD family protein [Methylocella sp. CPCC 101449]|jgi:hypothetical protein|uniref:YaiI/YqxD family protein n=1 Tax=Methylocella sp. CPCC 101449 TaxID=2987531 RepID=UPI00288ECA6D|nr:YaiI/YqxD family protein [Methylocella sp. CPCC 101449]MDT2022634.1 YaiI/YqxD family protein [Methylocella sp. CPCC 101449]HEV2572640.1 YaiI/YqxD family protein [Beijerinckiaceae bacterium]